MSRQQTILIIIGIVALALIVGGYVYYSQPKEIKIERVEYLQNGALQPMIENMVTHPAAGLASLASIRDNQVRLLSDDRVQYVVTYESETMVPELYDYFKSYLANVGFSVVSDMPSPDLSSFALDAVNGSDLFHLYVSRNVKDDGILFSDVVVSFVVK